MQNELLEYVNKHKGEDFLIVGSGPSSKVINDPAFVDKKPWRIVAVNKAYLYLKRVDYQISIDPIWDALKKANRHQDLDKLKEAKFPRFVQARLRTRCPYDAVFFPRRIQAQAESLVKDCAKGVDHSSLFAHGTTTHAAMHLAAIMGAKRIFLCGIDMTGSYRTPRVETGYRIIAAALNKHVEIINPSEHFALPLFRKGSFDE